MSSKEKEEKRLTVGELIVELSKMPQDNPVMVEGCDCYQDAGYVRDNGDYVLVGNVESSTGV